MGQQQLLLLIFVTFIVGIATIVSISVFGNVVTESNREAVRQDLLIAASNAQQLHERILAMDGISRDFDNMENRQLISRMNIPGVRTGESIQNDNGTYSISGKAEKELRIIGVPETGGEDIEIIVCLSISGTWMIDIDSPEATKPDGCE